MVDASRLLARDAETEAVIRLLDDVSEPSGVVLEGEPGIGKTTLWLHGLAQARKRGFTVLMARPAAADVGDWISSPVLSPDGAYLYVVSGGKILVIDTFTNSFVGEPISTVDEPLTLAVSTDGNLLYVASSAGDTLSVVYTGNQVDEKDV